MAILTIIIENIPDDYFYSTQKAIEKSDKEFCGAHIKHGNTYKFDFNEIGIEHFSNIASTASSLHSALTHLKQQGGN